MLQEDAAEKVFGDEEPPDEVPIEEAKLPDLDDLDDDFDDEDNEIDDDFEPFDGFDDFDNDADDIERHLEESERDSFQSVARNSDSKNSGLAKRKLFFTVLMTVFVVGLVGGGLFVFRDLFRGVVVEVVDTEFTRDIDLLDARATKVGQVKNEWRTAATRGVVEIVNVQEGDRVRPGEVLVRLKAPAALGKKLEKTRKAAVKVQAKLQAEELKLNEQNESLDEFGRQLEDIADELSEAESAGEKKKLKAEQRQITKKRKRFQKEIKASTRKLKSLRKKALQNQKKLDKIEASLAAYKVTSLSSGTVMQINASEGQKVKKGQKLVLLEDGGSLEIQFMMKSANVDDVAELPLVQIGAAVTEGFRASVKRRGKRALVSIIVAVGTNGRNLSPDDCALVGELGPTTLELTDDVLLLDDGQDRWVWGFRDDTLVRIMIDQVDEVDDRLIATLEPGMKPGEMQLIGAIEGIEPELFDEGTEFSFAEAGELSGDSAGEVDDESDEGVDESEE